MWAAAVSSNVAAREVVVCGELLGNLAVDRVDMRKGASLTGDVVGKRFNIEEGAFFESSVDMRLAEPKREPQATGTAPKATPAPLDGSVAK